MRLSGSAKVKFSGVGSIPNTSTTIGIKEGAADRTYDDGAVLKDYTEDANGKQVNLGLPRTHVWIFDNSSQVDTTNRTLSFHSLSTDPSPTGQVIVESKGRSIGFDIDISREFGRRNKLSWGSTFGASIHDVNVKTRQDVNTKLRVITDTYSLAGIDLGSTKSAKGWIRVPVWSSTPILDSNGNIIGYEQLKDAEGNPVWTRANPEPISLPDHPQSRDEGDSTLTDAVVAGYYQVRGSYITLRLGPYLAYNLNEYWQIRAGAGLTYTVLGAQFIYEQSYYAKDAIIKKWLLGGSTRELKTHVSTQFGYYAEAELDWLINKKTGFFLGAIHESYSTSPTYTHELMKADVSLSSGTGIKTGITTRF
jgi:hypothetical protein